MNFEILAPAGSMEALVAGVRCGANAVYLGGKSLNARRNAGNFNDENLKEAADYCHARGVKVYLTLNTLCRDDELADALSLAEYALSVGVDGFIIQDVGVAAAIKEALPQAKLHASTQMSIISPAGVAAVKEMGFSRAVLPREMTAQEIAEIRKSTDLELEIFVHGALCMSVSGQCYLSAMLGGRSGNRGLCAQPCRLSFSADNSGSFDLSLKDLSLIRDLKEIGELGVISLKIEGRMKRPEYVAAAVTAIKKAIDGELFEKDEQRLKSVFSRSGFTQGYFENKMGASMFGTRSKEDVVAASGVLKELSHLYDNETPLVRIDMDFVCRKNQPCRLSARALGREVCIEGDVPETAINKPISEESVCERLSKLGGTQFYAGDVNAQVDEGLIVSAAGINAMRREAAERLSRREEIEVIRNPIELPLPRENTARDLYFTARFVDASQIPDRHIFKRIFIPIRSSNEDFVDNRAGVEIPRGLFGAEEKIRLRLLQLKKIGVTKALCGNLGSYKLASDLGFEAFGDFGLNVFNSISASKFNSPILSFELQLSEANRINSPDAGVIVYGRLPLMLARNCPIKSNIGCEQCGKNGTLTDRKGIEFPVKCSPYPCVEVLNSVPLYMADRMNEVKTAFAHFYFTDESRAQVERILALYQNGAPADFKYTRGLYYRGVK